MDPISAGLGILGLGMQIFGGISASQEASKQYELGRQQQGLESQLNDQKHQAMLLSGRRQQLEIIRNNQRMRALALNNATSQGANMGSGLQGGYGQISGQSNDNMLNLNQNLQFGEQAYGINSQISGIRSQMSASQSRQSTDMGIASLGGTIGKAGPTISSLGQNLFAGFGNSGNYSGTPGASNTGGRY